MNISDLLLKLRDGNKVETSGEKELLEELAMALNVLIPKYACPKCWLERILRRENQSGG